MRVKFDDGGRAAAGYKGTTRDCVTRAIAIVTGKPYQEVYDALNAAATRERKGKRKRRRSSARTGVHKPTIRKYLAALGFKWTPTMRIGQGCKVHLRDGELPTGRLLVSVSRHLVAVIDGVIHDTHDCSRGGTRCVYGYFQLESQQTSQILAFPTPSSADDAPVRGKTPPSDRQTVFTQNRKEQHHEIL
jgi:hypothetical protein